MTTIKQKTNEVYLPLFTGLTPEGNKARYIILMGGRGAGRSTAASQYANAKLVAPDYFRCAIMRYVLGDIRNSIYQEIKDRAEENNALGNFEMNDGQMTIKYKHNTISAVGFKKSSHDQKAKLKSLANFSTVIIEEADEIPEEDFIQLDDSLRTMKGDVTIILLLNPPAKSHWIIQRFFNLEESGVKGFYIPKLKDTCTDTIFIRSSYKDNYLNLAEASIRNYENYQTSKPSHFYNMIAGYIPETVIGKIYNNWKEIDSVPHEAIFMGTGLDFGYTNDPTAIVNLYKYNGGLILDEIAYATGMKNKAIATVLSNREESGIVVPDSSEPKSIDEIKECDGSLVLIPAVKGKDSVKYGIAKVQGHKISYTKRSKNLKTEYENYAWFVDKDGTTHNEPKPRQKDHLMDASRYIITAIDPDEDLVDEMQDRAEARMRQPVNLH